MDVTVGGVRFAVEGDAVAGYYKADSEEIADTLWKSICRMALHMNIVTDGRYQVTDGVLDMNNDEDRLAIAALRAAKQAGGI
jgi:hypothetical protein